MNGVIQAVQEPQTALASNTATLPFSLVDLRTKSAENCRCWMNHNEGSALFSIIDGGAYEVHFDANVTSATAGQIAVSLFADGTQVIGTEMDAVITAPGEYENISFSKIIRTCDKGTVNLAITSLPTIVYETTVTDTQIPIFKNANIYIERLA